MIKATHADKARLIEYLSQDIDNCVYLYIDIKTYDICSENVNVWFDEEDGEIKSVVMKYYDSFQIYSRDEDIETAWIVEMINEYNLSMVSGPKHLVEKIVDGCEVYDVIYGEVFECVMEEVPYEDDLIKVATVDDTRELAEFLCKDPEFARNYKVEVLAKQLADRIERNLGRNYIIRVDGRIVANTSTFAEADDIAVFSGTVVDKEYRDTEFFDRVSYKLSRDLYAEGKRAFAFATNKRMRKYMSMIGRACGFYGKLLRNDKELSKLS